MTLFFVGFIILVYNLAANGASQNLPQQQSSLRSHPEEQLCVQSPLHSLVYLHFYRPQSRVLVLNLDRISHVAPINSRLL
jgi:hypothetical protein